MPLATNDLTQIDGVVQVLLMTQTDDGDQGLLGALHAIVAVPTMKIGALDHQGKELSTTTEIVILR